MAIDLQRLLSVVKNKEQKYSHLNFAGKINPDDMFGDGQDDVPEGINNEGGVNYNMRRPLAQGETVSDPNAYDVNAEASAYNPTVDNAVQPRQSSQLEDLQKQIADTAAAPAEKQSPWKQALFLIAQGLEKTFTSNKDKPFQLLGNARKSYKLNQLHEGLRPLYEQEKFKSDQAYKQAQIANVEYAPIAKQQEYNRKVSADKTRAAHYEGLLKDKTRGRDMQASQIEDLKTYRQWLMSNGDKDDAAKLKEVNARLEDYDLDRESRERIAAGNVTGRSEIADAKIKAKHEEFNAKLQSGGEAQVNKEVATTLQKYIAQNQLDVSNPEDAKQIEIARQKFTEMLRARSGVVSAGAILP